MPERTQGLDPISLVEAGIEAQLGLLDFDQQQELGNRLANRFGWKMAGDLAVAETAITVFDRDDYDLTVTALSDLGVKGTKRRPVPEFEEVQAKISPALAVYLQNHVRNGGKPELTMHVPLGLNGFDLKKLIANFDKKQEYSTYIWEDLWDQYGEGQHNSPRTLLDAAMLLNDTTDPENRAQPANSYDEAGLVHVSKTVPEQRASLDQEKQEAVKSGVELNPISISQYIVTQAKRRQAGLPLLDKPTYTRFVQYPEQVLDGSSCVPNAVVDDDDRLYLNGANVGSAWARDGVRRVVRVAEPLPL
jgi:hypothetical protein